MAFLLRLQPCLTSVFFTCVEQYRNLLKGLSKQQLLQYIEDKGNNRKSELRAAAVFQTMDCAHTRELSNSMQENSEMLKKEQRVFEQSMDQLRQDEQLEKEHIQKLQQQVLEKQKELD